MANGAWPDTTFDSEAVLMSVIKDQLNIRSGQVRGAWPILFVLLAAILVPTGCALWFMNVAMNNEQLAVRQRLTDLYRQQLIDTQRRIDHYITDLLDELQTAGGLPPAEAFEKIIQSHPARSIVVRDQIGRIRYPLPVDEYRNQFDHVDVEAQQLVRTAVEFVNNSKTDKAIFILAETLQQEKYRGARDPAGRLIAPNALLRVMELTSSKDDDLWQSARQQLVAMLESYVEPVMPSTQRVFLMQQIGRPHVIEMLNRRAEETAISFIGDESNLTKVRGGSVTKCGQWWALTSRDSRVIEILTDIHRTLQSLAPDEQTLAGAELRFIYEFETSDTKQPLLTIPASSYMSGWNIALYPNDPDLFTTAAARKKAVYLWTGSAGVLLIIILAAAVTAYFGKQIRLMRLKNNLIATVSHELKTPLASMRMLVDTLREGRVRDQAQTQQYFELISRENERLSRLIDNFLAFSRMERNRLTFNFETVNVRAIVNESVQSITERFTPPKHTLTVEVSEQIPVVRGDRDALITAILNLIDNAWKYTGDRKQISVRAFSSDGWIHIAVTDNGIGLPRRAKTKIFDRFYQVDLTLTRQAGGCGLGLSIVKFIIDAHEGTIDVTSQLNKGSTFTIKLPAAGDAHGR